MTHRLNNEDSLIKDMFGFFGGVLDFLFLTYLVFKAVDSALTEGFMAAYPYLMLYGVWCCSCTLVKITKILSRKQ